MGKRSNGYVHLYVNVSKEHPRSKRLFVAWVRDDEGHDYKPIARAQRIKLHDITRSAAKIYAVAMALDSVRQPSNIVIYTSREEIAKAIALDHVSGMALKRHAHECLEQAWTALDLAIRRHKDITAVHMHKDDHPFMRQACDFSNASLEAEFSRKSRRGPRQRILLTLETEELKRELDGKEDLGLAM
ncbi:MAG: hypothetical protein GC137_02215 [Alphaproteobacteria bacterium]|nr:hypothetical protein [Alphaproteobacteria bacterium]